MIKKCAGLVLVLYLMVVSVVHAETRQFGDVIYNMPKDWLSGKERDGTKVFLSDLPDKACSFCRFYIASSQPHTGTLTAFLRENSTLFFDDDDKHLLENLGELKSGKLSGLPSLTTSARYGNSKLVFLFAIDIGETRKVLLAFQGSIDSKQEIAEMGETLESSVLPVFDNLQFASAGGDGLLPAAMPGQMSGIWWGWDQVLNTFLDGTSSLSIKHQSVVFYPDGYFYDGSPPWGLNIPDRKTLLANFDNNLGVYSHIGKNRIQLTYSDGRTVTMERNKKSWTLQGVNLTEVQPLPDGFTLKGGVSQFDYSGFTPGSGISGGVATGSSTEFFPNGTYTGKSFGAVTGLAGGGGVATSSSSAKAGHYEVMNGLLVMTPKDGPARSQLVFRVGDGILIDDQFLKDD